MTCRCGETERSSTRHSFRKTVGGTTFVAETTVGACARCGEPANAAALAIAFERALAAELARRGPVSGETFRWVRKAAGLERAEASQLLGVAAERIAAWEDEQQPVDVAAWTVLAALLLDSVEGPRSLRTRLRHRHEGEQTQGPVHLEIDGTVVGTLGKAIDLLSGPIVFTDTDIADALDVDVEALRARLHDLAVLGLVTSASTPGSTALRWEPRTRDRAELLGALADAGVDVDAPLPRAKRLDGALPVQRRRITPVAWRAST